MAMGEAAMLTVVIWIFGEELLQILVHRTRFTDVNVRTLNPNAP